MLRDVNHFFDVEFDSIFTLEVSDLLVIIKDIKCLWNVSYFFALHVVRLSISEVWLKANNDSTCVSDYLSLYHLLLFSPIFDHEDLL